MKGAPAPWGQPYSPWDDATMIVDGPAARALGKLGRERWHRATGETLPADLIKKGHDIWPSDLIPEVENVDLGIARTRAAYEDTP